MTIRANPLPFLATASVGFVYPARSTGGTPFQGGAMLSFRVSPTNRFGYIISPSTSTGGNLLASSSLDSYCDTAGDGSRKAFVMTATRYACTTPWCGQDVGSPVDSSLDWVLEPDTTYIDASGAHLFTTHPSVPISQYGQNFANASVISGTSSHVGTVWGSGSWIELTPGTECDQPLRTLCVNQVPGVVPATH